MACRGDVQGLFAFFDIIPGRQFTVLLNLSLWLWTSCVGLYNHAEILRAPFLVQFAFVPVFLFMAFARRLGWVPTLIAAWIFIVSHISLSYSLQLRHYSGCWIPTILGLWAVHLSHEGKDRVAIPVAILSALLMVWGGFQMAPYLVALGLWSLLNKTPFSRHLVYALLLGGLGGYVFLDNMIEDMPHVFRLVSNVDRVTASSSLATLLFSGLCDIWPMILCLLLFMLRGVIRFRWHRLTGFIFLLMGVDVLWIMLVPSSCPPRYFVPQWPVVILGMAASFHAMVPTRKATVWAVVACLLITVYAGIRETDPVHFMPWYRESNVVKDSTGGKDIGIMGAYFHHKNYLPQEIHDEVIRRVDKDTVVILDDWPGLMYPFGTCHPERQMACSVFSLHAICIGFLVHFRIKNPDSNIFLVTKESQRAEEMAATMRLPDVSRQTVHEVYDNGYWKIFKYSP